MSQSRQPPGVPVGGQFSGAAHAEADGTLTVESAATDTEGTYLCVGTAAAGTPCTRFVAEKGSVCGQCAGQPLDDLGHPIGRGGFPRDGRGSATVTSVDGEAYKSGAKKGQIKMIGYRSGMPVQTSTEDLDNWKQDRLLSAMGRDDDATDRLAEALAETSDTDEAKAVYREFRDEAEVLAREQLAAQKGTFGHWLEACKEAGRSPIEGISRGEAVGIDADTQERIMYQWNAVNADHGFEFVTSAPTVVNDALKTAGTPNEIIRLTRPLTVDSDSGQVTIPAGTTMISDLNTGALRTGDDGRPAYWQRYAGQLATFSDGQPYDPQTGRRGTWDDVGGAPSKDWAVIVHADLRQAAIGRVGFNVFAVDLNQGRGLAHISESIREAEKAANASITPTPRPGR